jgi:UDP-N-acetylmuramate dehydrogenase
VPAAPTADAAPPDLPREVRRDVPLSRFSTIRTGGAAELFARVGDEHHLVELLRWAKAHDVPIAVLGSGSNLLIADEGVAGLVLKLDGELAAVAIEGVRMVCGAAARLPAVAARAAREGLSGIEFGVNIPGTVGGAVRMNAGAYGGALEQVLDWVDVATESGVLRRTPDELAMAYRSSNLRDGEIVARAGFLLAPAPPETIAATIADMRASRRRAQPGGVKTFGSTFKNPEATGSADGGGAGQGTTGRSAGELLDEAGCRGLRMGGARFSPKHSNFVENSGDASTADVVALMAEGRRRVLERFGVALQPEVQLLGPVHFPW